MTFSRVALFCLGDAHVVIFYVLVFAAAGKPVVARQIKCFDIEDIAFPWVDQRMCIGTAKFAVVLSLG